MTNEGSNQSTGTSGAGDKWLVTSDKNSSLKSPITRHSSLGTRHFSLITIYTALALLLTWPLALHLGSAYPATPGEGAQDLWQNLWNLWWASEALRRGVNPFFTDALFYPRGASLLFHPLNLTSGVLALPLRTVFGQIVIYNLLVVLSFVLSGYAVFLLAYQYSKSWMGALIGGLVYTGSAYHFFHLHLGHLEQISMQWLPFYALALDRLLQRPTIRNVVRTAFALLLVVFTSLYMTLYAALLTLIWIVGSDWRVTSVRNSSLTSLVTRHSPLIGLSAVVVLTLAVAGPVLLIPMAQESQHAAYMVRSIADSARGAAAPTDALLPPATHLLRRWVALPLPQSNGAFLGYLPLALALYGAITQLRTAVRWLVLAVSAWVLSLGPALPFYRLLYALPPIQVARYPDRFAMLTVLGVAVLAAIGVGQMLDSDRWRVTSDKIASQNPLVTRHSSLSVLLFCLVLLELYPGAAPLTPPIDNPFYHTLAGAHTDFSVLELPINRTNNTAVDMAAQTIHLHPILDGTLARDVPRIPVEWMPLIRELERPTAPPDIVIQPVATRAAALRFFNLHYLIYHRSDEHGPVTPPSATALTRVAGVPIVQVYTDSQLVAYRIDAPPGPATLASFATLGEGWYNLEGNGSAPHRWLRQAGGVVQLYAGSDGMATLTLKLIAYQQAQHLMFYLDKQQVGQIMAQPWITQITTPPFTLRAGVHTLRLVPIEPGTAPRTIGAGNDERPLTIALFALEIGSPQGSGVRSQGLGALGVIPGPWFLVPGSWRGPWSLIPGPRSLIPNLQSP